MSRLIEHSMNSPKLDMNSICYLSFPKNWTGMHSKYHLVSTPPNVMGPDENIIVISQKLNWSAQ
jgi:hypothetical protein